MRPPGLPVLALAAALLPGPAPLAGEPTAAAPGEGGSGGAPLSVPVRVVRAAMAFVGVPYVHGGAARDGVDCSGLVFRVFHDAAGLDLPRGVAGLAATGAPAASPIHLGDLLLFDTGGRSAPSLATHVGVYAGNDRFVHAASEGPRRRVIVSSLSEAYYRERFLGARRVIAWRSPELRITLTDLPSSTAQESPFASRENLKLVVCTEMTGGGPVEMRVYKNGIETLMRRIAPTAARPSEVSIVPDKGSWEVRIGRLYRGRELLAVRFTVEE